MQTKAQLVRFLISGTPGMLAYQNGRVTFTADDNEKLVDIPVTEITKFRPSWVGYGALLVIRAGGQKYTFRMYEQPPLGPQDYHSDLVAQGVNQAAKELKAIAKSRQLVKVWCQLLKEVKSS